MAPTHSASNQEWENPTIKSALYYPNTELQSAALLRTSLLLWDEVHFIFPDPCYKPFYGDKTQFARAYELIGRPHYPSTAEKTEAHELIVDFATRPLPEALFYRDPGSNLDDVSIFPEKFLDETWSVLEEAKLAGKKIKDYGYPLHEMCSLSIMSILADCCADKAFHRITDRGRAYGTLFGLLADETSPAAVKPDDAHERLVPISLKLVGVSDLDIDKLLVFREEEEKSSSGHELRALRHKYVDKLSEYAKRLSEATTAVEHKEIERQFEQYMKDDIAGLRSGLRLSKKETFLSKEILTIGVVGALAAGYFTGHVELGKELSHLVTLGGVPVTLGGAFLVGSKLQAKRHDILKDHPMGYLYEYS
jgi:hypothetical protein